ncbi:MAG TPA: dockerin type I domain-containing protein, partial [Candidatus Methylomirabilis sp.]|nr:dockerin type I domain-containing protein [Candidatus Methylomirabilis sp.]
MLNYDHNNNNLQKSAIKICFFLFLFTFLSTASGADNSHYDLNSNGFIDIGDLVIIRQHLNENTKAPYPPYDVNMDGVVNKADTALVSEHLGEAVEEPAEEQVPLMTISRYDLNSNGFIDIGDLVIIRQHLNENTKAPYPPYDVNMDGVVDKTDTAVVREHLGEKVGEQTAKDGSKMAPSPTPSLPTPVSTLSSLTISSNDGLKINLKKDGNIAGLSISGTQLPLLAGQGGFSFREVVADTPNLLANPGFEKGNSKPLNWEFVTVGGNTPTWDKISHSGTRSIKISIQGTKAITSGYPQSDLVKVKPLESYTISAWVKTQGAAGAPALRIVELDADKKILGQTDLHFEKGTNDWMQKKKTFQSKINTNYIFVYANIWESYGTFWVDDIELSTFFGQTKHLNGALTKNPDGTITQKTKEKDIDFTFNYIPKGRYIELQGEIQNRKGEERMLQIMYTLPVNAAGWEWGDYIGASRPISDSTHYENVYKIGNSRKQSVYPFASIDNNIHGLGIAVPMDVPRIYRKGYDLSEGYSIQYDFGLSDQTLKIGPGFANFTFVIYKIDEPQWGFRSAVKKYYELYPGFFEKRLNREGGWAVNTDLSLINNVSDFGFLFDESATNTKFNKASNIYSLSYNEPWGWWRSFGSNSEKPGYNERITALSDDLKSNSIWCYDILIKDIAKVTIDSAIISEQGNYYIDENPDFWHKWRGLWMQFYPTNPDPDIPSPNRFDISLKKYQESTKDGVHLDGSLIASNFENYNKKHWKNSDIPLNFGYASRQPALINMFSQYEYLNKMSKYLHNNNKISMMNTYPNMYVIHAPFVDIVGSEIGEIETGQESSYRRTLSYRKTNANLMNWKWGKASAAISHTEVERFIKEEMFYGIFPSIYNSGIGSYWSNSSLYERDRGLFKKYIPIIKEISKAGWEPIPYANINNPNIKIERYGSNDKVNLYYTVRNDQISLQKGTLTVNINNLGINENSISKVLLTELTSGATKELSPNDQIDLSIQIDSGETLV